MLLDLSWVATHTHPPPPPGSALDAKFTRRQLSTFKHQTGINDFGYLSVDILLNLLTKTCVEYDIWSVRDEIKLDQICQVSVVCMKGTLTWSWIHTKIPTFYFKMKC